MAPRWQVFLTCAFGSAIGSLVALQLNRPFWWLGLVIGGIVGYLSYEPAKVLAAFKQVFGELYQILTLEIWLPDKQYWLKLPVCAFCYTVYACTGYSGLFLFVAGMFWLAGPSASSDMETLHLLALAFFRASLWFGPIVVSAMVLLPDFFNATGQIWRGRPVAACQTGALDEAMRNVSWRNLLIWNPITVYCFLLPGYIVKGLIWFAPYFAEGCLEIIKGNLYVFRIVLTRIALFFLLIHCERRLLCGLYSVCGAFIGYQSASVLIGALAGGLIGLVVHELVERVSDRIVPVDLPVNWFA